MPLVIAQREFTIGTDDESGIEPAVGELRNLFDDATAYAGEWGVDETMNELARTYGFAAIVQLAIYPSLAQAKPASIYAAIILIMASQAMSAGHFTVGDFALFVAYLWEATEGLTFIGRSLAVQKQTDVSFDRMARLVDEDGALAFGPDAATREFRLAGQGEMHLRTALDRLRRKYGVTVDSRRPQTAYRETIRGKSTQRGKHKKQSGGHGQFGDVVLEVRSGTRGSGMVFDQKIHGGVVPKQYFGAVEEGVKDALLKGPLGFPVVDVEVTLLDGSYHAVDSSEIAFRTAARIGVHEALPLCSPVLLEPVHTVTRARENAGMAYFMFCDLSFFCGFSSTPKPSPSRAIDVSFRAGR